MNFIILIKWFEVNRRKMDWILCNGSVLEDHLILWKGWRELKLYCWVKALPRKKLVATGQHNWSSSWLSSSLRNFWSISWKRSVNDVNPSNLNCQTGWYIVANTIYLFYYLLHFFERNCLLDLGSRCHPWKGLSWWRWRWPSCWTNYFSK